MVIVAYRPRPGMEDELARIVGKHWRVLAGEGLVSNRQPFVGRSADGALIEVFEWKSTEAIAAAHANAVVQALWAEFEAVCTYVPIGSVAESSQLFTEFEAMPAWA